MLGLEETVQTSIPIVRLQRQFVTVASLCFRDTRVEISQRVSFFRQRENGRQVRQLKGLPVIDDRMRFVPLIGDRELWHVPSESAQKIESSANTVESSANAVE